MKQKNKKKNTAGSQELMTHVCSNKRDEEKKKSHETNYKFFTLSLMYNIIELERAMKKMKKKYKKLQKKMESQAHADRIVWDREVSMDQKLFQLGINYAAANGGEAFDVSVTQDIYLEDATFGNKIPGRFVEDCPVGSIMFIENLLDRDITHKSPALIVKTSKSTITVLSADCLDNDAEVDIPMYTSMELGRIVCRLTGERWSQDKSKEIYARINVEPVIYTLNINQKDTIPTEITDSQVVETSDDVW